MSEEKQEANTNEFLITIDGPSGVGKSSQAGMLAERLGFDRFDSGALYRAATLHCIREGIDFDDPAAVERTALAADLGLVRLDDEDRVTLAGEVLSEDDIRTPEVARRIAAVADLPSVRTKVNGLLRELAKGRRFVFDGRDMGTEVFPDAPIKIFLTASPEERARRRHAQLKERYPDFDESLEKTAYELAERDRRDASRPVGALRKADDAIEIITDGLSPDEALETIIRTIQSLVSFRDRMLSSLQELDEDA